MTGPRRGRVLTRGVSRSIAACELTHLQRRPIDLHRARSQHRAYERALEEFGYRVQRLPTLDDQPDAVFVEDCAVVLDRVAVITRPGAARRRAECASVREALRAHRTLLEIREPGTLDGGDVLRLGRRLLVGRTARSNDEGIAQLRAHLAPLGFAVEPVEVRACLHLKTAATAFGPEAVVLHPEWVDPAVFAGCERVEIDPTEPFAANVLALAGGVLAPAAHPRTVERLRAHGARVLTVEADELARAEGGLTCCGLVVEDPPGREDA